MKYYLAIASFLAFTQLSISKTVVFDRPSDTEPFEIVSISSTERLNISSMYVTRGGGVDAVIEDQTYRILDGENDLFWGIGNSNRIIFDGPLTLKISKRGIGDISIYGFITY